MEDYETCPYGDHDWVWEVESLSTGEFLEFQVCAECGEERD